MADRAALITGGSSGIGLAIARMLRDEGYALTLASRRHLEVEAAAEELGAVAIAAGVGAACAAIGAVRNVSDVGDAEACELLVGEHRERFGRLGPISDSAGLGLR